MEPFKLTASNPIVRPVKIMDEPQQIADYLQQLHPHLTRDLFDEAIRCGLEGRNDTTPASAPQAPGTQQWMKTVEGLRTVLVLLNWKIHNQQNCPFIRSPNRAIAISVMTGDRHTGQNTGIDPTNQADKGAVAQHFIEQNRQLALLAHENSQNPHVWVLLYHYDRAMEEVRFELSLPNDFYNKKITGWDVRLILGSLPNNAVDFNINEDAPNAPTTVEVAPKPRAF